MNEQQILTALKIAECGSITKAAGELYVSIQGAKERLDALEDELGGPLFVRSRRGLAPTPSGEKFCELADGLLRHMDEFKRAVESARTSVETIRILVWDNMQIDNIDAACDRFREDWPQVEVSYVPVTNPNFLDEIRHGVADVVLCAQDYLGSGDPELESAVCSGMSLGFRCLVSQDNPSVATASESPGSIALESLAGIPLALADEGLVPAALRATEFEATVPIERHAIMQWCRRGGACITTDSVMFNIPGVTSISLADVPPVPIVCAYKCPASSVVEKFVAAVCV